MGAGRPEEGPQGVQTGGGQRGHGQRRAPRNGRPNLGQARLGVGAEIGFVQKDHRFRPALADHDHLALQPPDIEVEVQPLDEEDRVDVGGQDLLLGPSSGGASRQAGAARQDGVDDGLGFLGVIGEGHPVADLGKVRGGLGLEEKTARDFRVPVAVVRRQDVALAALDDDPSEAESFGAEGARRLLPGRVPAQTAETVLGRIGDSFGHRRAQKPRKPELSRRGRPSLGRRWRTTYRMFLSSQKARFSGRSPSSLTR